MRRVLLAFTLLLVLAAPARADWLSDSLAFQYRLGNELPLVNAPWVGTHNSSNASTEPPANNQDYNQDLSIRQQLDIGVRSLEMDVHYVKGVPLVCHGFGADRNHGGCSTERPFDVRLRELRKWLKQHPKQVVLLYLEDHLQGGYDAGAKMLRAELGPFLYKPPAGSCAGMPLSLSRDDVRAAGKQVLAISSCGEGTAWRGLIFDDAARQELEGGVRDFQVRYPECDYSDHFQRYFEDRTRLTAALDKQDGILPAPLTPSITRAMTTCGVDLTGFDFLTRDDGRLAATIWSWAKGQPGKRRGCVVMAKRFRVADCDRKLPFACRSKAGKWRVTSAAVRGQDRPKRCRRGLPRTGYEAAKLRTVTDGAPVWLKLKA